VSAAEDAPLVDLVKRVATGDDAALGELYDATVGRVNGLALRILRSVPEAEEVVADVFHQVWRQAARFDPARGTAAAWIATIARTRALDRLRQLRRADREHGDATPEHDGAPDAGPEDLLLTVERGSAVHAALRTLAPVQRELLGLAFFRGLSHGEIAEATALPLGTVKTHIRRGLLALQDQLPGFAPEGGAR
jgi:RNA polymerase sigma-70 factor (ECF subfamily)